MHRLMASFRALNSTQIAGWVAAPWFQKSTIVLIIATIFLVSLESYPPLALPYGAAIEQAHEVVLLLFSVELLLRLAAFGRRPDRFFYDLWNSFDFLVILLCYLPTAPFAPVLRLLRVVRAVRLLFYVEQLDRERALTEQLEAAYRALAEEKQRSERLLYNTLPNRIAERLLQASRVATTTETAPLAEQFPSASVLFADLVGFTPLSATLPVPQLVTLLNTIFTAFDQLVEQHGVEKIKTIGDAYMVVAGVPEPQPDHLQRLAALALDLIATTARLKAELGFDLKLRVGLHCGAVVAGVIGQKRLEYDLWGDTVNIASRLESHGVPQQIQVSEAVYQQLKESFHLVERGVIALKGCGQKRTYFLLGR